MEEAQGHRQNLYLVWPKLPVFQRALTLGPGEWESLQLRGEVAIPQPGEGQGDPGPTEAYPPRAGEEQEGLGALGRGGFHCQELVSLCQELVQPLSPPTPKHLPPQAAPPPPPLL